MLASVFVTIGLTTALQSQPRWTQLRGVGGLFLGLTLAQVDLGQGGVTLAHGCPSKSKVSSIPGRWCSAFVLLGSPA